MSASSESDVREFRYTVGDIAERVEMNRYLRHNDRARWKWKAYLRQLAATPEVR